MFHLHLRTTPQFIHEIVTKIFFETFTFYFPVPFITFKIKLFVDYPINNFFFTSTHNKIL